MDTPGWQIRSMRELGEASELTTASGLGHEIDLTTRHPDFHGYA
jgi:hypothetical protein